jgi:predicted thioesterase
MFDLRSVVLPGASATVEKMLDESDTATYYGTGTLGKLIATPAYVALMIKAAVNAVEDRLPEGFVSVGRTLEFSHDAPTCLGMTLRVKATLIEIDGDRLNFEIIASDNYGTIGHGKHQRAVVSRDKLIERSHERCNL